MKGLTGSQLKVIAFIAMILDHIALFFIEPCSILYYFMRTVGRVSFPIFALLIAEGFRHTQNRWRYFALLLLTGVIAEPVWYLLIDEYSPNIMFTLVFGVIAMALIDVFFDSFGLAAVSVLLIFPLAELLQVDYGGVGVFAISSAYLCLKSDYVHCRALAALFLSLVMAQYNITGALLALFIMLFYNGKRGFIQDPCGKYIFYYLYPVHIYYLFGFEVLLK